MQCAGWAADSDLVSYQMTRSRRAPRLGHCVKQSGMEFKKRDRLLQVDSGLARKRPFTERGTRRLANVRNGRRRDLHPRDFNGRFQGATEA
jgi:hypothetical protein